MTTTPAPAVSEVPTQRVSATFRWNTPGPQPNGIQATEEGMWVIDQKDLKVYLLSWKDGSTILSFDTETNHSSGITVEPTGEIWVSSTFPPIELFRFSRDGKVLRRLDTPGKSEKSGAHGLEWIDGKLWVTVPPSATTYQLDPETGNILKQFPAPGNRPHGVGWDGNLLWVAETGKRTITAYTLEGQPVRVLELETGPAEGPDPHGMTYWKGDLWYCDADTSAMCTISIPK